MYLRNLRALTRLGKLNHFMQDFFRRWHESTKHATRSGIVDISQMPIIRETNQRLKERLSDAEFFPRFAANLAQLEKLADEIIAESSLPTSTPFAPPSHRLIRIDSFERVLAPRLHTQTERRQSKGELGSKASRGA